MVAGRRSPLRSFSMPWHTLHLGSASAATVVRISDLDILVGEIDGAWFAVEDRCSHAGCSFITDGEIDGTTLICNCHGSEFDVRTGEALTAPASNAIRTFPVRETGGRVEVEV